MTGDRPREGSGRGLRELDENLWVGGVLETYPDAQLFLAPGLAEKRPDLAPSGTLGDQTPAAWAGQVDQLLFRGFPLANEVVFLHRASSASQISAFSKLRVTRQVLKQIVWDTAAAA